MVKDNILAYGLDRGKKVFLTFDLDWCCDEVLEYVLDILESYNMKAILFVTHRTKLLGCIKRNRNFELGIHPNFNFLLQGDFRYGKSVEEVIKFYLDILPEARCVRSHSLTCSSIIYDAFKKCGLKYSFNLFIPYSSGIRIKPFRVFNGIIEFPHFWEDDAHLICKWSWDVQQYISYPGLKIFNFHPIHIFLNSESLDRYKKVKPYLKDCRKLREFVNEKMYGIRDFLVDLIESIAG